jgi:hypothetical protein
MGTWKDGNTHVYMIHVAKKKGKVTKQYNQPAPGKLLQP